MFFRIFCGFDIGYPGDVDVSFELAEIFDSSEPGTSIKLMQINLQSPVQSFRLFAHFR